MTIVAWPAPPPFDGSQRITNTRARPPGPGVTRTHEPRPIPVRARLDWELDGPEWIDTHMTAWTKTLVLVDIPDTRYAHTAAWMRHRDVEPR